MCWQDGSFCFIMRCCLKLFYGFSLGSILYLYMSDKELPFIANRHSSIFCLSWPLYIFPWYLIYSGFPFPVSNVGRVHLCCVHSAPKKSRTFPVPVRTVGEYQILAKTQLFLSMPKKIRWRSLIFFLTYSKSIHTEISSVRYYSSQIQVQICLPIGTSPGFFSDFSPFYF